MNEWTEKIERLELALEVRKHEQPLIAVLDKRIDLLEAENKRLKDALVEAAAYLRNDLFKTRVKNALDIIDEVLEANHEH